MQRAVLSALIVIEVHAKDVASKLVEQQVSSVNDFEWISQLRFVSLVLFLIVFLPLSLLLLSLMLTGESTAYYHFLILKVLKILCAQK